MAVTLLFILLGALVLAVAVPEVVDIYFMQSTLAHEAADGINMALLQQQVKDLGVLYEYTEQKRQERIDNMTQALGALDDNIARLRDSLHANNANHR